MRAAILASLLVVGCAQPARVVTPTPSVAPGLARELSDKRLARMWFRVGMAALRSGDFTEGIAALKRAYEIVPHPAVAYNLGIAHAEFGAIDDAITWYRVYLASNPKDATDVVETISRLEKHRDLHRYPLAR